MIVVAIFASRALVALNQFRSLAARVLGAILKFSGHGLGSLLLIGTVIERAILVVPVSDFVAIFVGAITFAPLL